MRALKFLSVLVAAILFAGTAHSVVNPDLAEVIYERASDNNRKSLSRIKRNGYSLDATDKQGNTALCRAIKENNRRAYDVLRVMGANTRHPCVQRVGMMKPAPTRMRPASVAKTASVSSGKYVYGTLGALTLGGATVAIAAGGGGGGGGSKGSAPAGGGDNPSSGGGDTPGSGGDNPSSGGGDTPGSGGGNDPSSGGGDTPGSGGDTPGSGGDDPSSGGGDTPGSGGDDPSSGGGDTPGSGGDDPSPVDWSARYKTNEYRQGNFLPMVKAAEAYGNLDKQNIQPEKVKVGIIDSGLYANNREFSGQNIRGYNYDHGPCRNGDRTNCWIWKNGSAQLFDNVGSSTPAERVLMSQEDFELWAADYPADYDWDLIKDTYDPLPNFSGMHGSHVAGIIAANRDGNGMHGVTNNAELVIVRRDMANLTEPAEDLIRDGVRVANLSLGVDATDLINAANINFIAATGQLDAYLPVYRRAHEAGIVLVIAAGNESQDQSNILSGVPLLPEFYNSTTGKTTYDTLINVVALDEDGKLASFSNKCGVTKNYCLAAPGTNIYSTGTFGIDYISMSGTSMATPVVTGAVAMIMGAYPYMSGSEVVSLLLESATDLSANDDGIADGVDEVYGHGLLNLENATQPQGTLSLVGGSAISGRKIDLNQSQIVVSSLFKNGFSRQMPRNMVAFDKYNRPFAVNPQVLVQQTHGGLRNFRRDLYAFSRPRPQRQISGADNVSFAFAASDNRNDGSLGMVEVSRSTDKGSSGFFFSESTKYQQQNYFEQALFNPYLALNQAYGVKNLYNYSPNLSFSFNLSAGENGLYDGDVSERDRDFDSLAYAADGSFSYKAADKLTLTAMGGMLYENDALLGMNGRGAFSIGDSNTVYAGLRLSYAPTADLTLSGAYYQGWTRSQNVASGLLSTSELQSDSFALDGNYRLNKTDVIGLQLSSPLRVRRGSAKLDLPVGRDNYSDEVYRRQYRLGLKPEAREYKFSLYHHTNLNEKMTLRSEFDMRLNPDHQKDADTDYRVMFGFNWNW